jgi:hypothetical protein
MKCSQAKPFTLTSSNAKMGSPAIKSYQKGGMVTKPKEYSPTMGPPPIDIDQLSALPPKERKKYEKKAEQQTRKDYPKK